VFIVVGAGYADWKSTDTGGTFECAINAGVQIFGYANVYFLNSDWDVIMQNIEICDPAQNMITPFDGSYR
jgi:hypothetical protein